MENYTTEEIKNMSEEEIVSTISKLKKTLLDFRVKQATRQSFKPHLIRSYKKQIARIMTIKHTNLIHS
uniref:Large ribosomal subunit protein uL29c n=1 Tax=Izziella formosana TaxID=1653389 RepID=A0A1G4NUX6_9FLOR|nr:Ribosomal protein L29 [Izziella formosana]SCW22414.1 Ribosomal protein L29 [Izziella formosana]